MNSFVTAFRVISSRASSAERGLAEDHLQNLLKLSEAAVIAAAYGAVPQSEIADVEKARAQALADVAAAIGRAAGLVK